MDPSSHLVGLPGAAWRSTTAFVKKHRFLSIVILIALLYGGYRAYAAVTATPSVVNYVTTTVATGTVVATMTETGQVSASQQLALSPKASGQVTAVYVMPGEHVYAGQAIAQLDATDAVEALQTAKLQLANAELTYQQNTASSTLALNVLQAQNAVTNADLSLTKAHDAAYADIANVYSDLSTVTSGLDSVLYDSDVTTRKNEQNIDAYHDIVSNRDDSIGIYASSAESSYTTALAAYNSALALYKATSRTASNDDLVSLAETTYAAVQSVATAVQDAHDFYDRVNNDYTLYNLGSASEITTLLSSISGYTTSVNNDLSSTLSDKSNIISAEQALALAQNSLDSVQSGSNTLTVQQADLTLKQAQQTVANDEQTVADYTVTAPFSGTVASVGVQTYDQAGSGTTVATLVTDQETVDLSVNEVDASKLKVGQKATITFDALPDITIAGTVSSVDTIGTVSSGVVSYDAVVTFDTPNSEVKPGMSATASIITGTESGIVVPTSAIKALGGRDTVQVFNPPLARSESTLGAPSATPPASVPVTTGLADETDTIVESGLSAGDQVVTRTISESSGSSASTAVAPSATSILGGARTTARPGAGGGATFRAGGAVGGAAFGRGG